MGEQLKVVFKIEIATLINGDGRLSLKKMERLAMICTSLINSGVQILVVSSGAIVLGSSKLGLKGQPESQTQKQAVAALGQAELIKVYQNYFDEFDQIVAQVLLTKDVIENPVRNMNAKATLKNLINRQIVPVINENDSVSTDDIDLNDNYPLALNVATLVNADMIIVKSESDGKFLIILKNNNSIIVDEQGLFDYIEKYKDVKILQGIGEAGFPSSLKELNFA